jgi:hypothetical protein
LKYTEADSAIHSEPAGKGRKKKTKNKKTLVLTISSPTEKGRKNNNNNNKTLLLTLGNPPEKGRKKRKKKKDPGTNPRQRHLKYTERSCLSVHLSIEVLKPRIGTSTDAQTHRQTTQLIK